MLYFIWHLQRFDRTQPCSDFSCSINFLLSHFLALNSLFSGFLLFALFLLVSIYIREQIFTIKLLYLVVLKLLLPFDLCSQLFIHSHVVSLKAFSNMGITRCAFNSRDKVFRLFLSFLALFSTFFFFLIFSTFFRGIGYLFHFLLDIRIFLVV
jgi:hypothetical protein